MALITSFTVWGSARPQGSTKGITRPVMDKATGQPRRDPHTGQVLMRTAITHSNRDSLMQWRTDIRAAIQLYAPQFKEQLIRGPVAVRALFHMARPDYPKHKVFPIVAPDLDKLQRAVGDAFETVLIKNDSQIVGWAAWKVYTDGASKADFEVWTPDSLPAHAPVNPFAQPGLF